MPGDLLTDLLGESIDTQAAAPYPGGGIFAPPTPQDIAARKAPIIGALVHQIATGREPAAVPKPYQGGLLGRLGVTSQYQNVQPGGQLDDTLRLAKQITDRQGRQETLDKLDALLKGTQLLGSDYGKNLATTLGAPELAQAMPAGMEGKGQMAQQAQTARLQQQMMSNDLRERQLADKEWSMQLNAAIREGNYERADQLQQLRERGLKLQQEKFEDDPIMKVLTTRQSRLQSQNNELLKQLNDPATSEEQQKLINDRIDANQRSIDDIDEGIADAGTDVTKLRELLRRRPGSTTPAPTDSGRVAIKKGLFTPGYGGVDTGGR